MSDLYILFERSNSLVGKLGRIFIPYPYTHVTISFDGETYHSFSRRHFHDPFDAGLTDEKLAKTYAEAAHQRVAKLFTVGKMMEEMDKCYQELSDRAE